MTATMITNEDSTLDALNEPSLDFLLYGKEREASIEDSFLYDTTDDLIIDEKTLSQTSNGMLHPFIWFKICNFFKYTVYPRLSAAALI